jgi:hypothetical protein
MWNTVLSYGPHLAGPENIDLDFSMAKVCSERRIDFALADAPAVSARRDGVDPRLVSDKSSLMYLKFDSEKHKN